MKIFKYLLIVILLYITACSQNKAIENNSANTEALAEADTTQAGHIKEDSADYIYTNVSFPITSKNFERMFVPNTAHAQDFMLKPEIIYPIVNGLFIFKYFPDIEAYYLVKTRSDNSNDINTLLIAQKWPIENLLNVYIDFTIDENWNIYLEYSQGAYSKRKVYKKEKYRIKNNDFVLTDISIIDSKISEKWRGNYSVYVETEATTTGMASIEYFFDIQENYVVVDKNTCHEPINCTGKYIAIENKDILTLYYIDEDYGCGNAALSIKCENGIYYIFGVGGEGTNREWIELKKI